LVLLCAGCAGSSGGTTIATTFDPCDPPSVVAQAGASDAQNAGIAGALALWRAHGAPLLGTSATGTIEVRFQHAAPLFRGFYDDHAGVIYINDDLSDPQTLAIVVAHELGHAFGLYHISPDVRPSVMNPGNVTVTPTDEDQRTLEASWGVCSGGS
jgi:hypothetical protein